MSAKINPNTSIHNVSQKTYLSDILLKKIQTESLLLLEPSKFKIQVF